MSHVLDKFQFCPVCGSNHFEINNIKSKKCKDCGFSYYLNPSSATVALILNSKEELLAVRRKKDPAKGALDLPGGFVDMDETGEGGKVSVQLPKSLSLLRFHGSYPRHVLRSEGERRHSYRSNGRCRRIILDTIEQAQSR